MVVGIVIVLLTIFVSTSVATSGQKVLLKDVSTLVFSSGEMTSGRRNSSIPQLTCEGGYELCKYRASSIGCQNIGWDGNDVVWKCEVNGALEPNVKLGKTVVSCEGYDYPDDSFVLKGSCGISYHLDRTNFDGYDSRPPTGVYVFSFMCFCLLIFSLIGCLCSGDSYEYTGRRRRYYSSSHGSDYGYDTGLAHGYLVSSLVNSSSSWCSRGYSNSECSSWGSVNSSGFATTTRR